jgi:hypothetical protein
MGVEARYVPGSAFRFAVRGDLTIAPAGKPGCYRRNRANHFLSATTPINTSTTNNTGARL